MRESPANSLPGALNPGFGGPGPAILAVLKYLYIFSVLCLHYSMRNVKICIMKYFLSTLCCIGYDLGLVTLLCVFLYRINKN